MNNHRANECTSNLMYKMIKKKRWCFVLQKQHILEMRIRMAFCKRMNVEDAITAGYMNVNRLIVN